jgi:hypothetical protein
MPKGIQKRNDELTPIEGGGGGGGYRSSLSDIGVIGGSILGGAAIQGAVMSDIKKSKDENAEKVREINSRSQYNHERSAGDPNALKLSFEEWKKL